MHYLKIYNIFLINVIQIQLYVSIEYHYLYLMYCQECKDNELKGWEDSKHDHIQETKQQLDSSKILFFLFIYILSTRS